MVFVIAVIHLEQKHIKTSKFTNKRLGGEKELMNRDMEYTSRTTKVGLNLIITYSGLRQHKPRSSFEEDILTAKLNGPDVGDLSHSRIFAQELDTAIYEQMKVNIKTQLETKLDATQEKRPLGMVFALMTPSKQTVQIHALVVPVPENPLSQPLLVPLCLEVPAVTEHDVAGLARLSLF